MPATAESATSQSDPQRTTDLDTLTQRLQATEMMLMLLASNVPQPNGFLNGLEALLKAVKSLESTPPKDRAEYVATVERTRDFVRTVLELRAERHAQ